MPLTSLFKEILGSPVCHIFSIYFLISLENGEKNSRCCGGCRLLAEWRIALLVKATRVLIPLQLVHPKPWQLLDVPKSCLRTVCGRVTGPATVHRTLSTSTPRWGRRQPQTPWLQGRCWTCVTCSVRWPRDVIIQLQLMPCLSQKCIWMQTCALSTKPVDFGGFQT